MNILDSNTLINLKNRYGLRITKSSSVSIYCMRERLRKHLNEGCSIIIPNKFDRDSTIGRIIDKCEDSETLDGVRNYFDADTTAFAIEAQGKIRTFFKSVRKYSN